MLECLSESVIELWIILVALRLPPREVRSIG